MLILIPTLVFSIVWSDLAHLSQGTRKISSPIRLYTHFNVIFLIKKLLNNDIYKIITSLFLSCVSRKFARSLHTTLLIKYLLAYFYHHAISISCIFFSSFFFSHITISISFVFSSFYFFVLWSYCDIYFFHTLSFQFFSSGLLYLSLAFFKITSLFL